MTLDFLGTLQRTHGCGALRASDAASSVTVMGWVNRRRDHGDLIFLDLRDRSGVTQVVLDKSISPEAHARAEQARPEFVVAVTGTVRLREPGMANPKMATGDIEVVGNTLPPAERRENAPVLPCGRRHQQRGNPPQVSLHRSPPPVEMQTELHRTRP